MTGVPQGIAPAFSSTVTAYTGGIDLPWLHLSPMAMDPEAVMEVRVNGGAFSRIAPGTPLAAGRNFVLGLKSDSGIVQWGSNNYDGSVIPPAGLTDVVSVASGYVFNLALRRNGTVRAWGHPNVAFLSNISSVTGAVAIFAGDNHAYIIKDNGTLVGWSPIPLPAGGVSNVISICQNDGAVVAAKADGSVVGWTAAGLQPSMVPAGLSGVSMVVCSNSKAAALKMDGTVYFWPDDPASTNPFPKNPGLKDIVSISAGDGYFLALGCDGKVTAVGNGPGALVPAGLQGVTAIASQGQYSAALKDDGTLVMWGSVLPDNLPAPQGSQFATWAPTVSVPLSLGGNAVDVRVTSPPGTPAKTYTLNLNRTPNPALLLLEPDRGALMPAFSPEGTSYTMSLPFASDGIRFRPFTKATGTTVTWNGTTIPTDAFSNPLPLQQGSNAFTFRATAEDGITLRDYQVTVTREAPGTNRTLRFLADDADALTPAFSPTQLNYTHATAMRQPRLRVWPKVGAVSAKLEVRINGGSYVRLSSGNPATVDAVLKPDGFPVWWDRTDLTKRVQSTQPVVPCGAISTGTGGYLAVRTDGTVFSRDPNVAKVPAGLTGVVELTEIEPTNGHAYISVALRGSGTVQAWQSRTGAAVAVFPGETRLVAISGGHVLTGVRRDGTLAIWNPPTEVYPLSPPNPLPANLVATNAGRMASVLRSDGSAFVWGSGAFDPSYTFTATGVAGLLSGIAMEYFHLGSDGRPTVPDGLPSNLRFPAGLTDVRLLRANYWNNLAVKADGGVVVWANANSTPDGTGVPAELRSQAFPESAVLPLGLGNNQVEVRVTAENGEINTYTLTVSREANLELASVSLNHGEFPVTPSEGISTFAFPVPAGRESITFEATLKDETETMVLNGTPLPAGTTATVSLVPGINTVTLVVFDQDQATSRTYMFTVTRSIAGAELLSLATSEGPTVPAFTSAVQQYSRSTNRPNAVVWASPARSELERRTSPAAPWVKMSGGSLLAKAGTILAWVKPDGTVSIAGPSPEPEQPAGLVGICSIAAGQMHLTALRTEGTVVSWGGGPGANQPAGLVDIKAVSAAAQYSLVLKADGTVIGWGTNSHGQLNIPAGLSGVTALSAQGGTTPWCLALRKDGTVAAWGAGAAGLLPVPAGLQGVVAVTGLSDSFNTALQMRAAALLETGRVIFWNVLTGALEPEFPWMHDMVAISGNLGLRRDGAFYDLASGGPVYSSAITGVVTLEGGMAVKQDGSAWMISGQSFAQPVAGAVVEVRPSWVALTLVPGVNPALEFRVTEGASQEETQVVFTRTARTDLRFLAADGPALVPAFDRSVRTYSLGSHAGSTLRLRPAPVNPNSVVQVRVNGGAWTRTASAEGFEGTDTLSSTHPIFVREDGKISGWDVSGFNISAQASELLFGRKAVSAARGVGVNLVLLEDGSPLAGQPYPPPFPELAVPPDVRNQAAISLGERHAVSLGEDGLVRAWGNNEDGKLAVPPGLSAVVQVRAGRNHSLALRADGSVVAWGRNTDGQSSVPAGLSGVVAIAAGHTQSMALKRDGTVVVWGNLGDGSSGVPSGLRNVTLIAADAGACVAVKEDGTAVRWGDADSAYGPGSSPDLWEGVLGLSPGYGPVLAALPGNVLRNWAGTTAYIDAVGGVFQELKPQVVALPLASGPNTIEVRVSEPDGSISAVTTLTVTRIANPGLASLQVAGLALTPAFDPAVDTYATEVAAGTTSMHLRLAPQESDATLSVNGMAVSGGSMLIPLPPGALSPISITVTSADGTAARTFQIQFSRALPSTLAGLGLLTTGSGVISPPFDPLVKSYQQDCRFSLASVRAVPMGTGARMEVSLNGGSWQNLFHGQRLADTEGGSLIMGPGGGVRGWTDGRYGSLYDLPEGLTEAVSVAAYDKHLLALKPDGTVVAWGDNTQGQSSVPAGLKDVIAIAAGSFHSMALRQNGTVVVWGAGASGVTDVPAGLTDVTAISAGTGHCLALRRDGTVVTWGTIPPSLAVPAGLSGITAIAAVNSFSTALKPDGTPVSWGVSPPTWPATFFSALLDPWGVGVVGADGMVIPSAPGGGGLYIPADLGPVVSLLGNRAIGLAVRADGTVRHWGSSSIAPPANTLGDTRPLYLPFPLHHGLNTAMVRVTAEDGTSQDTYQIAINRLPNTDLSLLRLSPGILSPAYQADVTTYSASVPFYQSSLELTATAADTTSVVSVNGAVPASGKTVIPLNQGVNTLLVDVAAADGLTTLRRTITVTRQASLATGSLRGLGSSAGGVMNTFAPALYAYTATPPAGDFIYWPRSAAAGAALSYRRNGGAWELLNGTGTAPAAGSSAFVIALRTDGTVVSWSTDPNVPPVPGGLSGVVSLAAGTSHSMALTALGGVIVWGSGGSGMQPPANLPETAAIASGRSHCLALGLAGTVTAWGTNTSQQTNVPVALPPAMAIAGGSTHSLALTRDGRVFSWGSMAQSTVPANLPPVVAISAGDNFSVVLKNDGTVAAWGDNSYGQRTVPATLTNVVQIACGGRHVLALRSDGKVTAWGDNASAQRTVPADLTDVVAVNAGGSFSLAVKRDGRLVVWGVSTSGQRNIPANLLIPAFDSFGTVPALPGLITAEFRVLSPDGLDSRTYSVNSTLSLQAAYSAWSASAFPSGTAATLTAATADFDRDGVANIIEYVSGTHPASFSPGPLGVSIVDGMLEMRWSRRAGMGDGFGVLEGSPSLLGPWSDILLDGMIKTSGSSGDPDLMTLRQPLSGNRYFLRLRVTLP